MDEGGAHKRLQRLLHVSGELEKASLDELDRVLDGQLFCFVVEGVRTRSLGNPVHELFFFATYSVGALILWRMASEVYEEISSGENLCLHRILTFFRFSCQQLQGDAVLAQGLRKP